MLPNCLQYPVCLLGTLLAGAVVVNVNPLYTAAELRHQLEDSGAAVLVVLENFAGTAAAALPGTGVGKVVVTGLGDLLGPLRGTGVNLMLRHVARQVPRWSIPGAARLPAALAAGRRHGLHPVRTGPEDLAFLQYTGGTTGVAKGAMLTHRNLLANILQARAWAGEAAERQVRNVVTLLPLYHIFSLTVNCLLFMTYGARNVLVANPRDTRRVARMLRGERFEAVAGINALFHALLEQPAFLARDFSDLRLTLAGGAATQAGVAERWQRVTGRPVVEGYGLTECAPIVTIGPIDLDHPEAMRWTGSIGLPVPSTEVRFRRPDGSLAAPGEAGELCVRGPQVMRGYWRRPEETAQVLDAEGWLRTGDIGVMDEHGFIRLVDRIKDMILVSGFNVYPSEVEAVALAHPLVREAAAVGVPDPVSGERVKLIVVPRDEGLTEQALIEHCRQSLTGYKVPRLVEFRRAPLPKSPVGKVLRRELRQPG
jgi:long-chain acyl-CoA synthetase